MQLVFERIKFLSCELDQKQRSGLTIHKAFQFYLKLRNLRREFEHGLVHQLHGIRSQFDEVLGGRHSVIEGWKVAHAQHRVFRDRLEIEVDFIGNRECAFRADQQMGQVERRPCL